MGIYYPEITCGITEFIYVFYVFSLKNSPPFFYYNIKIKGDYIQLGPNLQFNNQCCELANVFNDSYTTCIYNQPFLNY